MYAAILTEVGWKVPIPKIYFGQVHYTCTFKNYHRYIVSSHKGDKI